MSEDKFTQAIQLFRDGFDKNKTVSQGLLETYLHTNGLASALSQLQKLAVKVKKMIEKISKDNPSVDELRFIAVVSTDFLAQYYIVQGMVVENENQSAVNEIIFKNTYGNIIAFSQVFPAVIEQIFQHIVR